MEDKNQWLQSKWLTNQEKKELERATLVEEKNLLNHALDFGTGGLRGIFGPGPNRMNSLTIARTAVSFGKYIQKKGNKGCVIIGYDNRYFSKQFATVSGEVLSALGISVKIFPKLTPTPLVSFAIRHEKAAGGIVITASHNPPQYNGFKAYDETGCQLLPAAVAEVQEIMKEYQGVFDISRSKAQIEEISAEIIPHYLHELSSQIPFQIKKLKIGYSPLHGTGGEVMALAMSYFQFKNFQVLKEQGVPDPEFSNTDSPNPENPESFSHLKVKGIEAGWDLLLATDPDADRLGAYYRDSSGKYQRLTGNQIGAIFTAYLLEKESNKKYLVKTIVTSSLGATIAERNGLKVIDVLTGFKYIGDQINRLGEAGFLLGYEESFGLLFNPLTRDKDGIQSGILLATIANDLQGKGLTLGDYLQQLYKKYGYYAESQIAITLAGSEGADKIKKIFAFLSEQLKKDAHYYEDYELSIRQYQTGQVEALTLPKEKVLKVVYQDGHWICVRPSGTEPKLKIYLGIQQKEITDASLLELEHYIKDLLTTQGVHLEEDYGKKPQ